METGGNESSPKWMVYPMVSRKILGDSYIKCYQYTRQPSIRQLRFRLWDFPSGWLNWLFIDAQHQVRTWMAYHLGKADFCGSCGTQHGPTINLIVESSRFSSRLILRCLASFFEVGQYAKFHPNYFAKKYRNPNPPHLPPRKNRSWRAFQEAYRHVLKDTFLHILKRVDW